MKKKIEQEIYNVMRKNEKVVLLTADDESEELSMIENEFPSRFYRIGIAECNLLGMAAGLSKLGFIPIAYTYGVFLINRALDFLRCDICINKYNVKIIGWGSGVKINNYGASHHTTEDLGILRTLPNIDIAVPASCNEIGSVLNESIEKEGPCYIRIGKSFEKEIFSCDVPFSYGKSDVIQEGDDLTFFSTGNIISNVIEASIRLKENGISAQIVNVSSIKPLDVDRIIKSIQKTGKVIVVEEHQINCGLGSAVAEVIADNNLSCSFLRMGFNNKYATEFGWHKDILEQNNLGVDDIYNAAIGLMK